MPYRTDLTNAQYERLRPHLAPAVRPRRGRPRAGDRRLLNAILWRLDNGAKWRALPAEYGPWPTVYLRFRQWTESGVWQRVLAELQAGARRDGALSFEFAALDAPSVRAHRCAAGAQKKEDGTPEETQARQGLGRSRGGFTTKIHLLCDGAGRPLACTLTEGQRHEATQAEALPTTPLFTWRAFCSGSKGCS